jgi:PAS domain S-box-containing protein
MYSRIKNLRHSLVYKLILAVGMTLLLIITAWAYFNIKYQKEKLMNNILAGTDKLTNTIKLGAHYAMMLNSRDDINQIINNIAKQPELENIRIYNKEGQIKFSNEPSEVDLTTNIKAEACDICHRTEPPLSELDLSERLRIFDSAKGYRLLGIISPIKNEPGCATGDCHVHPSDKKILGALDVVVSLEATDSAILDEKKGIIGLAALVFLITSAIIFIFVLRFVNRPIRKLIGETRLIAKGEYNKTVDINRDDEIGQLAVAINKMGREIGEKQTELNRQRDEYQNLFERVPCLITVQDREFKLLRYNQEFSDGFNPQKGDYCYHAYKGRDRKCDHCPVEGTFEDGQSHYGEETGMIGDGTIKHWIFRTSPIFDDKGNIVAAMEISLDITERKQLEVELEKSEKKYHAIFSNIPNPVFVLDTETFKILDCNKSVEVVYGYQVNEMLNRSFLDLFQEEERDYYSYKIVNTEVLNQAKHLNKEGKILYVNIRVSPSEYSQKKVFLVTTSDITKRLEAEQQLIQASKMATLGEMATGVAHELNQPLSVIKTASSFLLKKIKQKEKIEDDILSTLLTKADNNVDRATKIINHMRQFARKSDMDLKKIDVNIVLKRAFEIFSQQLKVRGIDVIWETEKNLPKISADSDRLEQVFINLLINARDAIEQKGKTIGGELPDNKITISTMATEKEVVVKVEDTGIGISEAIRDKLFEPFFTTKQVGKGTGLGLSISYGIIKECHGSIKALSTKEGGARFIIKFPIAD